MDRLKDKVAVVTGASSGIGAGTVRRFVAEGAHCLIVDIQDDVGQALAKELGEAAVYQRADVAVEGEVAAAVSRAVDLWGRIDCMFNNAGILGAVGPITGIDAEGWRRTIDVLLTSVFFGIKHAGRAMVAQGSGVIVNTASTAGVRAGLGPHVYTAAKHGVVGLTQSCATELGRFGVRVNAIAPGGTTTGLTANLVIGDHTALDEAAKVIGADNPLGRGGTIEDVANAALYLASDEASFVNGAVLVVDGAGETIADRNHRFVKMGSQMVQEAGRTGL